MARGTFKCAECGDQVYFNVGKNRRETDRHAAWLESQGRLCEECDAKQRQAHNAQCAEENAAAGLPALTGSEKQVAWAESIRSQRMGHIRQALAGELAPMYLEAFWGNPEYYRTTPPMAVDDPNVGYAIDLLKKQTSAHWWIDNRETRIGHLLKNLFVTNPPPIEEPEPVKEAKAEAQAEATIRPESPLTETVAEIRVHEKSVEIVFPEKREDFWQIVKKQLDYTWSDTSWKRSLGVTTGTPADRAAEAGNKLLNAGFIIRIFDPAIRQAAIDGAFEQECHRWISRKGDDNSRFLIRWDGRDERLYNAARKLKGSKYDSTAKAVIVRAEHFDEVLDFAQMYEFRLTLGAQEAVNLARSARDAALVATPAQVEDHIPPTPGIKPRKLKVPDNVDIDVELSDNVFICYKMIGPVEYAVGKDKIYKEASDLFEFKYSLSIPVMAREEHGVTIFISKFDPPKVLVSLSNGYTIKPGRDGHRHIYSCSEYRDFIEHEICGNWQDGRATIPAFEDIQHAIRIGAAKILDQSE